MDEAELEDWFTGKREALEESALKVLSEPKGDMEEARARFDAQYRALVAEYQKKQTALYEQQRRSARLHAPIVRWRMWWRERTHAGKAALDRGKLAVRKRFFDWKFRRMLKHWRPG